MAPLPPSPAARPGCYASEFAAPADPERRFAHGSYTLALAALERAIRRGAAVSILLGPRGSGRSLLGMDLAQQLRLAGRPCARLVLAAADPAGSVVPRVARAFGLQTRGADAAVAMAAFLRRQARSGAAATLVLDEARHLTPAQLDALFRLGGGRDEPGALLHLVLLGAHPGLSDWLRQPALEHLWHAAGGVVELRPLDAPQLRAYVLHRLRRGGWTGTPCISGEALRALYGLSGGLPAQIDRIMALALRRPGVRREGVVQRRDIERAAALAGVEAPLALPGFALARIVPALGPLDGAVAAEYGAVAAPDRNAEPAPADRADRASVAGRSRARLAALPWRRRLALAACAAALCGYAGIAGAPPLSGAVSQATPPLVAATHPDSGG